MNEREKGHLQLLRKIRDAKSADLKLMENGRLTTQNREGSETKWRDTTAEQMERLKEEIADLNQLIADHDGHS